jgi:hypothetical protein
MPAQLQPSNKSGSWLGWSAVGAIVVMAIFGSSGTTPSTQTLTSNTDQNAAPSTEVPTQPELQLPAVDTPSVARAARHLKLALDAEGFSGAMIYSENCFSSLASHFAWGKLDQCEAFDVLTQIAMSQSDERGPEATYFDKDAVEARFTTIGSQHHGETGSMRSHLSELTEAAYAKIAELQTDNARSQSWETNTLDEPDPSAAETPASSENAAESSDFGEGHPSNITN